MENAFMTFHSTLHSLVDHKHDVRRTVVDPHAGRHPGIGVLV
ncbi:hypothetical protein Rhow_000770 [Rhodococcus wratislaviensis]|uniref:Uncharacterized protein n=1 Tax=Rhodococcus wratislaviensis TaxID=44752 RepID=A0A402C2U0_RHOWR|nr:hypothetical protein Rhow_000770 [Rhodococcus wratislaviensis]